MVMEKGSPVLVLQHNALCNRQDRTESSVAALWTSRWTKCHKCLAHKRAQRERHAPTITQNGRQRERERKEKKWLQLSSSCGGKHEKIAQTVWTHSRWSTGDARVILNVTVHGETRGLNWFCWSQFWSKLCTTTEQLEPTAFTSFSHMLLYFHNTVSIKVSTIFKSLFHATSNQVQYTVTRVLDEALAEEDSHQWWPRISSSNSKNLLETSKNVGRVL